MNNIEEILKRIEKLEKKNRNMRMFNILLFAFIGALGLFAFQSKPEMPRIIEAEKFVLRDPELGVLGFFGYSKREDKRAEMIVTDVALSMNGGVLNIARGSQNVTIDASKLSFYDKSLSNQKIVEIVNSNEPSIELTSYQKDGKSENINLSPTKLFIFAKKGKKEGLSGIVPKVSLGKGENINTGLNLFDENGRLRAVLGSAVSKDASGQNIISPESNLVLYDSTGKPFYRQPK